MAVPTAVPDVQHVAALTRRESESLAGVLEGLTAEQWRLPACGGRAWPFLPRTGE